MSNVTQFTNKQIDVIETTITSGQTTSGAIKVYGATFAAIEFPATMTSTSITLQGSIDKGVTFKDIYTPIGGIATYSIGGADRVLVIDPIVTYPFDEVKIVGAAEGADRTLKIKAFSI